MCWKPTQWGHTELFSATVLLKHTQPHADNENRENKTVVSRSGDQSADQTRQPKIKLRSPKLSAVVGKHLCDLEQKGTK